MEGRTASPRGLDVSRQLGPGWGQEWVSLWCLGTLQPMRRLGQGKRSSGKVLFSLHATSLSVCLPFCCGLPHHTLMTVLVNATNEGLQL